MCSERIKNILKIVKGDYFDVEENLITGGYISSFDLLSIIEIMEQTFGVSIPIGELRPEDFDSISNMSAIINRYTQSGLSE